MKNNNSIQILDCLIDCLEKNNINEDKQKIKYLSNELKKIKKQLPTYSKLEEIEKIIIDLEVKYEAFYELSNYFDPLYVEIKKTIHDKEVKQMREENRRKREKK